MQNQLQGKLLLATNNPGKLIELRSLLAELPKVELFSPEELNIKLQVDETGVDYAENAVLKARAFALASGMAALADDSGLEVDALEGAPGLFSARYAPQPGATDADRRAYLLKNLAGMDLPWPARFRAVIAVAQPNGIVQVAEGVCEGEIIPEERGTGGFGYDPIFLLQGGDKTMAELSETEKNLVSHRARAVQAAMPVLKNIFGI
ncbi:MAG: RdgB/HAM1 family non-canonical purine NTP pyrophosphatase [Chloroflexi bacterium]|nr:RdgB/HAM1 family non-canonical purine NTP pyrophosphatase [Chloroflexota bacterium]